MRKKVQLVPRLNLNIYTGCPIYTYIYIYIYIHIESVMRNLSFHLNNWRWLTFKRLSKVKAMIPTYACLEIKQLLYETLFYMLCFWNIRLSHFNWFTLYIYMYRVSVKKGRCMAEVKENKKVPYHFANFAIVNELLIIKNRRISPAYWLMQARDEMRPPCQRGC